MEQLDLESPRATRRKTPARCFREQDDKRAYDDVASRTVSGFLWSAKGNPIMGGSLPTSARHDQPYLLGCKSEAS